LFASSAAVGLKATGTCRDAMIRQRAAAAAETDDDDDEP